MNSDIKNDQFKMLNLACGSKVASAGNWTNVDFSSPIGDVIEMNILKGLSFSDNSFSVVYTAQFIEHLTLDQAKKVLQEVNRVLIPGGILRIVTPDLEELASSYLESLNTLKDSASAFDVSKYNWLRIEMFDQIVRDYSGGEMKPYLAQVDDEMKKYLNERIGHSFYPRVTSNEKVKHFDTSDVFRKLRKIPKKLLNLTLSFFESRFSKIGRFRQSGEVHQYLHDTYSLSHILAASGFISISKVNPHVSAIQNWQTYELDVINGQIDGPLALYMEAQKPIGK